MSLDHGTSPVDGRSLEHGTSAEASKGPAQTAGPVQTAGPPHGSLSPLAEGVWVDRDPVTFLGLHLSVNMTVLKLPDGSLVLYSPIRLTPERRASIDALGPVAHLYAPNVMHHSWLGEWAAAYPSARVHAPPGLEKKRRELRVERVHGSPEPAFDGALDEVRIEGFRLEESVLVHRASQTLVVADLVQNIGRPEHAWTRFYTTAMGFYDRVALSRFIRWTAFSDRQAARRSLDAVLALPFEHLIVGHGTPVTSGAKAALAAAYAWL